MQKQFKGKKKKLSCLIGVIVENLNFGGGLVEWELGNYSEVGCLGVKDIFLSNWSLVLSLFKIRGVGVFLKKKMSFPNRRSPLNNSIDNIYTYYL